MKKIAGRSVSEILWSLGDWVHYPMRWFDWAWIYPVYNRLMTWSSDVQDWAGCSGPWQGQPYIIENDHE